MPTISLTSQYAIKQPVREVFPKRVEIKAYNPFGAFIGVLTNADIVSFINDINGGLGECVLNIAEKFDTSLPEIQLGNRIDVYISDRNTIQTIETYIRIYSGYISSIEPQITEDELVIVRMLGFHTKLGLDILKNETRTKLGTKANDGLQTDGTVAAAADIGDVARAIIARYVAETSNSIIVPPDEDGIPDIGEDMTFTFNEKTYAEALEKCRAIAPSGTHWRVDANGVVHFGDTGSEHKLIVGKHIANIRIKKNIEQVRNVLIVNAATASLYKSYSDVNSIQLYGRRIERMFDSGIEDEDTADLIASRFLTDNARPIVQIECDVIDDAFADGYDIESLQPGDTVTFFNLASEISSALQEDMVITRIEYAFERARITVEPVRSGIVDIQERLKKELKETQTDGTPPTYTT